MSKSKSETVRVVKTDNLNQRKLTRIARRYNVTPEDVRELQLGHSVDICPRAAEHMERDGFVKPTRSRPRPKPERLNKLTTEDTTATVTPEDGIVTVTIEASLGENIDSVNNEENL